MSDQSRMNDALTPALSQGERGQALPKAKRFRIGWWMPVGVVLALGGAALLLRHRPDPGDAVIDRIRISESATINHPGGATESAIERFKGAFSKRDYYLHVIADTGEQNTAVRDNTPIGNGLTFDLPTPVPLRWLREVRVMHDGLLGDPIIDRVDVRGSLQAGQLFTFQMLAPPTAAPPPWRRVAGWSLVGVGGLLVLITVARFVWQQVV